MIRRLLGGRVSLVVVAVLLCTLTATGVTSPARASAVPKPPPGFDPYTATQQQLSMYGMQRYTGAVSSILAGEGYTYTIGGVTTTFITPAPTSPSC